MAKTKRTKKVVKSETTPEVNKTDKTEAKPTKRFKIVMDFGNRVEFGEGDTVLEALENVRKPVKIVAKTFIIVTDGRRKANLMFAPNHAKRLFYPLAQQYFAKQFEILLRDHDVQSFLPRY